MTTLLVEKILPCPFCGQIPDEEDEDFCYPITRADAKVVIYRAGCVEAAGGCGAEVLGHSAEEAIQRWNTRYK